MTVRGSATGERQRPVARRGRRGPPAFFRPPGGAPGTHPKAGGSPEARMAEIHGTVRQRCCFVVAAALLLSETLFSLSARADGGPPAAYGILFEPGNPSHIVLHSQYWGLFDGHEGSTSWSLLCSQAFGGRATEIQKFP